MVNFKRMYIDFRLTGKQNPLPILGKGKPKTYPILGRGAVQKQCNPPQFGDTSEK